MPYQDKWLANNERYPNNLHVKAYEYGFGGILYPKEYSGQRPADFNAFHELILWDELERVGGTGVMGQMAINSMAVPPIIYYGSQYLKDLVLGPVVRGEKNCALCISEPTAGSDVGNIKGTAVKEGDYWIVNKQGKWITGAHMADFFTTVVRTGGPGAGGLSLLLIPRDSPGIKVRKMETMFSTTHGTNFVEFEDVKVPVQNMIGKEGEAMKMVMVNFNHERFVLATRGLRCARLCYSESIHEALTRRTFGKKLIEHQVIRFKLAEMARQVEALQALTESVAYAFSTGVADRDLGSQCALLKVQASKTFEYCAREAVQTFGGSGLVREGRGQVVERLYRAVREISIPGGSEGEFLSIEHVCDERILTTSANRNLIGFGHSRGHQREIIRGTFNLKKMKDCIFVSVDVVREGGVVASYCQSSHFAIPDGRKKKEKKHCHPVYPLE